MVSSAFFRAASPAVTFIDIILGFVLQVGGGPLRRTEQISRPQAGLLRRLQHLFERLGHPVVDLAAGFEAHDMVLMRLLVICLLHGVPGVDQQEIPGCPRRLNIASGRRRVRCLRRGGRRRLGTRGSRRLCLQRSRLSDGGLRDGRAGHGRRFGYLGRNRNRRENGRRAGRGAERHPENPEKGRAGEAERRRTRGAGQPDPRFDFPLHRNIPLLPDDASIPQQPPCIKHFTGF